MDKRDSLERNAAAITKFRRSSRTTGFDSVDYATADDPRSNGSNSLARKCFYYIKFGFLIVLRRLFYRCGRHVASYPATHILVILTIAVALTSGIYRAKLSRNIKDGYTPYEAPSRYETQVYQNFYEMVGKEPTKVALLIQAKDRGSLVRPHVFERLAELSHFVTKQFSVQFEGRHYNYSAFCESMCMIDTVIQQFKDGLRNNSDFTQVDYPLSSLHGIQFNVATYFFGIQHNYSSTTNNKLSQVSVIMLPYSIYASDEKTHKIATKWEMALFDYIYGKYDDDLIHVTAMGDRMVMNEMNRGGMSMARYFAAGFVCMCLFIMLTVGGSAFYHGEMSCARMLVAWAALLSPILACGVTFGFICWIGIELYPLLMLVPYLVLAIGVDDAFLMIHAWHRLGVSSTSGTRVSTAQRFGLVLEDIGPSMTITSLTNMLAFGIGASTDTPVIRVFCITTAIAMVVDFAFEIVFFGSILSLLARWDAHSVSDPTLVQPVHPIGHFRKRLRQYIDSLVLLYCKLLISWPVRVLMVLSAIGFWIIALYHAAKISTVVSIRKILPHDSPLARADDILEAYVWKEYYPVTVLVNRAPDSHNQTQMYEFKQLLYDYEHQPKAMGANFTHLWLRTYSDYHRTQMTDWFGFFADDDDKEREQNESSLSEPNWPESNFESVDWDLLHGFFALPTNAPYKMDVALDSDNKRIMSFAFHTAYRNATNWNERVEFMNLWRSLAVKYPQFNVSIYSPNGYICDAIMNLRPVCEQTVFLSLCCMAVVCMLFIPSFWGVVCAALAIASTSLGVVGSLSLWGNDLDPITLAAVLMSIGFSVDFTAHTSYHFQKVNLEAPTQHPLTQTQRLLYTMNSVAWPMCQAGISTIVCVVPLAFHGDYPPTVFVTTIYLLVSWGLIHGLVILPTMLAMLPDCYTLTPTNDDDGMSECDDKLTVTHNTNNGEVVLLHHPVQGTSITLLQDGEMELED